MRQLWTTREIEAPAEAVWAVLVDTELWPAWGPTVRAVDLDTRRIRAGSRGRVQTSVGVWLPFEVTRFGEGRFEEARTWAWKVAGVPATEHRVEELGDRRCRLGFATPLVAAPYLGVCAVALGKIDRLARR